MDARKSFQLVRQNQNVQPVQQHGQRQSKRTKDSVFQYVNLISQVIQILSKEKAFRTKEEISLVAIVIKQSNFFRFYEKELEKSPSALKQIVESMGYESFIAGQEIYTEKERARKVYIVLQGDVCILSQKIKKDRFRNTNEAIKNINNQNKNINLEQLTFQQSNKQKSQYEGELILEKSLSHNFNQFKQLESKTQYDFFGDTDVRYLSKHSFSAIAKTKVECAVIPQEVFNVYLGETSEIAMQVKEMLKCSLFKFLDPQYVEYCLKYSKEINFPKQKIIFKEGDVSSEVYYIKQGDIELSATLPKESQQEIKVEEIDTNIAAMAQNENNEDAIDDFDPEKFIKSNLFNQTLYEKGGPVSKNRQFWNQGDTEGQDYITKLKEQLNYKCKQFQQRGIQYTQINVEDQVKKFMIGSLSQRFQDKQKANFFSQAINRNTNNGLKLALLSKGGYFGEEIIFKRALMHSANNSPSSSPQIKDQKKQKSQNYFFDASNNHRDKNQKNESKNKNQEQKDQQESNFTRQYTVKCQSASCILLKIEMEIYLSLIYLNQKQAQARKYLESQIKQERRELKLKNHLKLIFKPNKILTQQNESEWALGSIKPGKGVQFFTNTNTNSEDPSTPSSKKLDFQQKLNLSSSQFFAKKQEYNNNINNSNNLDSSTSINPYLEKQQQIRSQAKSIQLNETRQKNISECLSTHSQSNYQQLNKIKPRNSVDKLNLNQSQDFTNFDNTNANKTNKKSVKNNNSLQIQHQIDQTQQDFSDIFNSYMKNESLSSKKNQSDQNLKPLIGSQSRAALKQTQMREEIDKMYQTFSSILQKEENRQRQISLMTNSLEKICNNSYYYGLQQKESSDQKLSLTLPTNQNNFTEQSVQKDIQFMSPIQSAQKNGGEKVFFSSHYSQLNQVINNQYNNDNKITTDQIKKNISMGNLNQNNKLMFKKQSPEQVKEFISQNELLNSIQKQKLLRDEFKTGNGFKKNFNTNEENENNQQENQLNNESKCNSKSQLISSNNNNSENESLIRNVSFQLKEQILNNQKDDCILEQDQLFVFDQQSSPIYNSSSSNNNQISFLQNSFISVQEDDKDNQFIQTNNSQQQNSTQKKFIIRDKNVFIYPKQYALQPLFSEIIENEVVKLQQSEKKKQTERVKIEINQDFYIKRYRKAYKEAVDLKLRPEKKQVNSIFDNIEEDTPDKQNKKQMEQNMSLIIQKKFQIDKKFPDSQRAKEINDFFRNQIKKMDEQHKMKLEKFKREKDINAIITKQLVNKLEQQNIKRRNDLNYAGTYFNFILKDSDKKNNTNVKNNNVSQENQKFIK